MEDLQQKFNELRIFAERLDERIKALENSNSVPLVEEIKKESFINAFNIIKAEKYIFDNFYNQASEPIVPVNSFAFWLDSDAGPAYYLLFNFNGTQKKVALT